MSILTFNPFVPVVFLLIYFCYCPKTCSHHTKVCHRTNHICDAPIRSVTELAPRSSDVLMCEQKSYSWFSHDVSKIQTKKLSLLLSLYFHVILEHLKNFIQKIFGSKGFFVLQYRTLEFPGFRVTQHLAGGRESSYVG